MARASKKLRRLADVFQDLETVERAKVGELTREQATQERMLRMMAGLGAAV